MQMHQITGRRMSRKQQNDFRACVHNFPNLVSTVKGIRLLLRLGATGNSFPLQLMALRTHQPEENGRSVVKTIFVFSSTKKNKSDVRSI